VFSAARDDVVYEVSTAHQQGHSPIVSNHWAYPSRPRPGQLVQDRGTSVSLDGVAEHDDREAKFVMPPESSFASGSADVKVELVWVDYLQKNWSDTENFVLPETNPDSFALITHEINAGQWTVTKTTLNGRAALKLSFSVTTGIAEIFSVSAIPGTSEALASGELLPNGGSSATSVVYQYS
jgi:hypothetical protein